MEQRQIAFIGAGNMAKAIIAGFVGNGYPATQITATAPTDRHLLPLANNYGIRTSHDNHQTVQQADVVVLAVKPQLMADVCRHFHDIDLSQKLVISIAAGISCQRLSEMLNAPDLNLIRVMPNTPSLINQGMSGLFATTSVTETDRAFTTALFQSVGEVCWVSDESQINGIIAAAGSAPAYFFLFMEAMQKEAIAQGFDTETARLLVQQSAVGAAAMVQANPDTDLATLREQVTSKGGTTAEAIRTFNEHNFPEVVAQAMQAAVKRAEAMEKQF
ncbi:Pyrroline-5-carboxylate reductase [Vibrio ruber DSM 16370]|uniref:Pyrroline-5-carboxylate reductase n=1 Tax=Vibrio ruber (strain DSM 16370 / JCM 11486 / BCRC 17186 / CECT 7878 / LMG 23124 / VR1) TaxID=1123498 RepID=A0A1R4LSG7_VIBR1|nr:pyrroline-5-carboxylate reductase [Vibrio ruber]SJN59455.1 Pyrroline-5-carboxylate reductase [Vibrio ruber DSM 16370]